jgi:hypothetical protein
MASEPVTDLQDEVETPSAFQKRTRAEAIQRLQVGLSGLGAMLLLLSLAYIIQARVKDTDKAAVPQTIASVSGDGTQPANKDPLVDAGVIPELPAQPAGGPDAGSDGADASPAAKH